MSVANHRLRSAGGGLRGIEYTPPHASAQIKSCVLLAGLAASGETVVREATSTRRHTEDMLELCGADIEESDHDGVHVVRVRASTLHPFDLTVPGDPSQAAFWVVGACVIPDSEVRLPGVDVGKGRRGFLDVLVRMGADVTESEPAQSATGPDSADLCVRYSPLVATEVHSSEITGLDEVPVLAVAAAIADGTTVFREVGELRVKESDRLSGIVTLLRAFGASAEVRGDDLVVHGGARSQGGRVPRFGRSPHGDGSCDRRDRFVGWRAERHRRLGVRAHELPRIQRRPRGFVGTPVTRVVRTVAIDGPAGAGKSTLAANLAQHLGLDRLDTGAMYRAVAWAALERGVDPADDEAVAEIARSIDIDQRRGVRVDGHDATRAIRTEPVDAAVSIVAANPAVRTELVRRQRAWVEEHGGGVLEGRDIGTVVIPDADLKVYLTADSDERARRRAAERGQEHAVGKVEAALARRDRLDSTRSASPLPLPGQATDAMVVDSTNKSAMSILQEVLGCLRTG